MKKIILLFFVSFWVCTFLNAQPTETSPKIIFSKDQKPTTANSKDNFTSGEFIYGSVDLGGKTVKDFFKIPDSKDKAPAYLFYVAELYSGTDLLGDNSWNFTLVKEATKKSTILYFDVLPDPTKATTVMSGTPIFDAGLSSAPLYSFVAKQYFKSTGNYTLKIRIYNRTLDAYGNEQPFEKWPTVSGSFTFAFNEDNVPVLLKNSDAADELVKKNALK